VLAAQKALSKEKTVHSTIDKALAEERTARQVVEQALQSSKEANAKLAQELETTQAFLTATRDKLTAKSYALDTQVIQVNQGRIQLEKAEGKQKTTKEKLKI
jgi:hypothetical protein